MNNSITFSEWSALINTIDHISHAPSHSIIWRDTSAFPDRQKQCVSFGYGHGCDWITFQQADGCILRLAEPTNLDANFCLLDIDGQRGVAVQIPTYFVKSLLNVAIAFLGVPEEWERSGLIRASWYTPMQIESGDDDSDTFEESGSDNGDDIPF